jgi:hypothetical protein
LFVVSDKDFVAVDYHGKGVSHLDALSHISYQGQLFGGHPARESVGAAGARVGEAVGASARSRSSASWPPAGCCSTSPAPAASVPSTGTVTVRPRRARGG